MFLHIPKHTPAPRHGFTLVELTIVLLILSMLAALFAVTGAARLDENKATITRTRLETLQSALLAFRQSNHRLPCPADASLTIASANYGIEAANAGSCTGGSPAANFTGVGSNVAGGSVPTKALGMGDDMMYDGWGRKITYVVDTRTTAACSFTTYPVTNLTIGFTIKDANLNTRLTTAWYVLISHGANGHGAYLSSGVRYSSGSTNTNEQTNCHCNSSAVNTGFTSIFVDQPITESSGANVTNHFDDIVRYGTRMQLLSSADQSGTTETCP